MKNDINVQDLDLILLPGREPPAQYAEYYQKAYQCWREVWEHAYKMELNNDRPMFSDNFTRQDEILALFYQGRCAGLSFFKWVNTLETPVREDSYFETWPETAFHKLRSQGNQVIVCSQFTLHFEFRNNYLGLPWKDLLMAFNAKRFLLSSADAMAGTTRLAKNVGEVTYRTGATPLVKNMAFSSDEVRVDLVAWFKGKVGPSSVPGIAEIVEEVCAHRLHSLVQPLKNEVKRAA